MEVSALLSFEGDGNAQRFPFGRLASVTQSCSQRSFIRVVLFCHRSLIFFALRYLLGEHRHFIYPLRCQWTCGTFTISPLQSETTALDAHVCLLGRRQVSAGCEAGVAPLSRGAWASRSVPSGPPPPSAGGVSCCWASSSVPGITGPLNSFQPWAFQLVSIFLAAGTSLITCFLIPGTC